MLKPWAAGWFFLAFAAHAVFSSPPLEPRSAASPMIVPPSQYFDGDDGPWSSFFLRVGTPEQEVRVLVSTSASVALVVMSEYGCTTAVMNPVSSNCASSRGALFDQNASATWANIGTYAINGNGVGLGASMDYKQNADFGLDTLGLGIVNGTNGPVLESQVVGAMATASPFYLGIFGLSPQPANFSSIGNFFAPSYFQALKNNDMIPSLSWSYTAGAQYRLKQVYGQLIFGGMDTSRFESNSVSFTLADDITRDIVVAVQSIAYSGDSQKMLLSDPIYASIDSTDPNIWLPAAACRQFEEVFGLTLDNDTGLYLVNDTHHSDLLATDAQVTFVLSDSPSGGEAVSVILPYQAFAREVKYPKADNDSYYFPLKQAANDTQYLTVDYGRRNFSVSQCTWLEGASENIVTIYSSETETQSTGNVTAKFGQTSTNTKMSVGTISGIVVGAAAAIVISIGGLICMRKRGRSHSELSTPLQEDGSAVEEKDEMDKPSFYMPAKQDGAFPTETELENTQAPPLEMRGGELYELEAHMPEMDASTKSSMQKRDSVETIIPVSYDLTPGTTGTPISDLTITWDKFESSAEFSSINTTWSECGSLGSVVIEGTRTAEDNDTVYIVEAFNMTAHVDIEGELDLSIDERISLRRWPPMSVYDDAATSTDILGDEIDLNVEVDLSIEIALVFKFSAAVKFSTGFDVTIPGGVAVIYNLDNGEVLLSQSFAQDTTFDFDGFNLDEGTEISASAALQVRVQAGVSFDEHTYVAGADANLVNVTVSAGISDDCDFYIEGAADSGIDVYHATFAADNAFDSNADPVWAETFTVWTSWSTCEIPATTSSSEAKITSPVSGVPLSLLGPHYITSSTVATSTAPVSEVPLSLLGPHNSFIATVGVSTTSSSTDTAGTRTTNPVALTIAPVSGTLTSGSAVGTGKSVYRNTRYQPNS
ncbi:acid protease, partial [Aureobasidium melanogenum]